MKNNTGKITIYTIVITAIVVTIIFFIRESLNKEANNKEITVTNQAQAKTQEEDKTETPEQELKNYEIYPDDIILGNHDAPVTIIEYASLSCPHCASFYNESFDKLKSEYIDKGKVKFVYRDFPLNQPALAASVVALCQYNSDKDIENYHSLIKSLFKSQDSWAFSEDFIQKLEAIINLKGMSSEKFKQCISDSSLQEQILKARIKAAEEVQIKSTPTFIINNHVTYGYRSWDRTKSIIDHNLSDTKENNS